MKKILIAIILLLIPLTILANTEVKQSTERVVIVGPFVDVSDGYTPETGVTLGAADEAELIKLGGGVTDISGSTWTTTGVPGWYELTLTSGNTDTLGDITIVIQDDSVCLPVWKTFSVVTANVYDSKYSTDKLEVDVTLFEGADASDTLIGADGDTLETLSDQMDGIGSAPTAVEIRQEIDSNSTQLAAILEDTGTTIPATLSTIWEKLKRLVF